MPRNILKKIGLVDEEINIYITLLKLSKSKATTLSKELDMARSTVYRFLTSLQEKGLVSENIIDNVKYFYPTDPKRIPEILQERVNAVQSIIPELNSLKNKSFVNASVELYKGKEGIKTILRDIIREGKDYTFLGEASKFFEGVDMEIFSKQWIRQVEKSNLTGRLLCSQEQNFKVAKTEKYRLLPHELIPEISTWTYGTKTAQFIWSNPFYVVLINNISVTKSNKILFEYLWKNAKKPSKKHTVDTRLTI